MALNDIDWGASGRRDSYSFYLVDPFTLQETGETLEVDASNSSITWGYYTDNLYTASLTTTNDVSNNRLVRVKQTTQIPGYDPIITTLGTFFITNTGESAKYKLKTTELNCYSTYYRYTQDKLNTDFSRPIGYNVIQEIGEIIQAKGGHLNVKPGSPTYRTHTQNIFFEFGTNIATVINTIAGWIGCQMGVDGDGFITIEPYISPLDRPIKYTFDCGNNCVYLPGVELEENSDGAVNQVIAYWQTQNYENGQTQTRSDRAVVQLEDGNKFSFRTIGRYLTAILEYPDVEWGKEPSHETLVQYAERYLRDNQGYTRYLEIEACSIPGLTVGDCVQYINNTDFEEPISRRCMITEIDMSLNLGGMSTYRLKVLDE